MGTYSKRLLLELERRLRGAHEIKTDPKLRHTGMADALPTPNGLAQELGISEAYIRRFAWERKLDAFPGSAKENDMWLAAYCVVALGWSVNDASKELGFKKASIEAFLFRHGWRRYVCWGRQETNLLHLPKPLAHFNVRREPAGWREDYSRYDAKSNYFSKRRRV